MRPPLHVVVYIGPDHDLYHTSRVFTGLSALRRRRAISLRYEVPPAAERWLVADPVVVCLDIHCGTRRRVAVDLRDGLGRSWPIVDRVDRYFKRAFYQPELAELPQHLAAKVQPFGLNYGCRSIDSALSVLARIGPALLRQGRSGLKRIRQYLSTPTSFVFEQEPDAPVEAKVMFQTRLWTEHEVPPDEVRPLNESRVEMVRALRAAFGAQFVGGLVPTSFAREHYPQELTPHPSRYVEYLRLKKRCLVSVYTRGVEHSLAFKLGETLAASQCLVSVPLRYELPRPLTAGENYLAFETPEQAIAACRRLLDDSALADKMRRANHDYYVREVEPAAHIANVLARAASV